MKYNNYKRMNIQYFNILIMLFVLLYYNGVTHGVESSFDKKGTVKFSDDTFVSGTDTDYGTSTKGSDSHFQCPNLKLVDKRNIKATRQRITKCNRVSMSCDVAEHSKFRTIDGSCNNVKHPSLGKSKTCLNRILPFEYADDISVPRNTSCTGVPLPNARLISNDFHIARSMKYDPHFTTHFMEWGQMLGHDFALNDLHKTAESDYNFPVECCKDGPVINDICIAIPVSASDPFYSKHGVTCLDFARTIPCNCSGGSRVHLNNNTGFIDSSILYGNTKNASDTLRAFSNGTMKVEYNEKSGPMLPTVPIEDVCISPTEKPACYHSGDTRTDQNLFLLTVNTYLLRYHNFICEKLNGINPDWNDERLFQEARRILIATVQYITYKYYLPHVLGEVMKEDLQIVPGKYTIYNPDVDPTVTDEFSAWAARYGHTQIPPRLSLVNPETGNQDSIMLRDYFFNPFEFCCGQYDKIAIGMTIDKPKKRDVSLSDEVRNYLYKPPNYTAGQDLAALSIVRGRDHGMPGYTYYLLHLLNKPVHTFDDLNGLMPKELVELLKGLYSSVHDIDVYSGAFAEYPVRGGFVGPLIAVVLEDQYRRALYGDRYWYKHGNQAGSFTPSQLSEIEKSFLSRILCDTAEISEIQLDVFLPPSPANLIRPCENITEFDFSLWKE